MLAEVRKFGLFLVLAHQYFEQLDEDIIAAALNNCQIKAVFGGLSVTNARRMAEELFIGKLDPKKIKASIYQTKFWPEYRRDKAYGKSSSSGSATARMESTASASFSGLAAGESFYTADNWFGSACAGRHQRNDQLRDPRRRPAAATATCIATPPASPKSISRFSFLSPSRSCPACSTTAGRAIDRTDRCPEEPVSAPLLHPDPPAGNPAHAGAVRGTGDDVQLFAQESRLVHPASAREAERFAGREVDRLLVEQEAALLQNIGSAVAAEDSPAEEPSEVSTPAQEPREPRKPIWDRAGSSSNRGKPTRESPATKTQRKRGPRPDVANHTKVAALVRRYDDDWVLDENLIEICEALDQQRVPIPKTWPSRTDGKSHTWSRAVQNYPAWSSRPSKTAARLLPDRRSEQTSR